MSPFCKICEKLFANQQEDNVVDCIVCGQECCTDCIDKDHVCNVCSSATVGTLIEAHAGKPEPLTDEELNPANWEFNRFDTDCGWCCTPNGCMGHLTPLVESVSIGRYTIKFPVDDLTDKTDWDNVEAIGKKLKEIVEFYTKYHEPAARQADDRTPTPL